MSFDWKDFLTLAEGLKGTPNIFGTPEAAFRSAASRAYYAAFRAALEFGRAEKYDYPASADDHRRIQEYFRGFTPRHDKRAKISTQLNRLHDLRRQADYDNSENLKHKPEHLAEYAIGMAKTIFQCLDELAG